MSESEKLIEVYKAANDMEAQVIKGLLESCDIPCLLRSNAARSVHAFAVDGMGEVRVMVWEQTADEARSLIKGREDG